MKPTSKSRCPFVCFVWFYLHFFFFYFINYYRNKRSATTSASDQTRKPSDKLAENCARMACMLFMIFFWWPTRVMPSAVRSATVSRATAFMPTIPACSKLSRYLAILIEHSHSLTDPNWVMSGASELRGFTDLKKFGRIRRHILRKSRL